MNTNENKGIEDSTEAAIRTNEDANMARDHRKRWSAARRGASGSGQGAGEHRVNRKRTRTRVGIKSGDVLVRRLLSVSWGSGAAGASVTPCSGHGCVSFCNSEAETEVA